MRDFDLTKIIVTREGEDCNTRYDLKIFRVFVGITGEGAMVEGCACFRLRE